MKKLILLVAVFGLIMSSCGNKTQQNTDELDSTEQCILADSVVAQLDSLANTIEAVADTTDLGKILTKEKINLAADQQKVKPDYLITEEDLKDLQTLQQKYVAIAYLSIDRNIQQIYNDSEGDDYYNHAIARLATEAEAVNKEQAEAAGKAPITRSGFENFYKDMKTRNRLDKFYVATAAYLVEGLYVISRNVDVYMPSISDEAAANICKRLASSINGIELIAANNPDMKPVVDALAPIKVLNATTAAELKDQIVKANEALAKARAALLKA